MSWLDTLRTSLDAMRSHRMRSGLTVLGILIGIAAVILTVGLGVGAQQQVTAQVEALGTNLLIISPGSTTSTTGLRGGFGSASTLTQADAQALTSPVVAPSARRIASSRARSTADAESVHATPSVEAVQRGLREGIFSIEISRQGRSRGKAQTRLLRHGLKGNVIGSGNPVEIRRHLKIA